MGLYELAEGISEILEDDIPAEHFITGFTEDDTRYYAQLLQNNVNATGYSYAEIDNAIDSVLIDLMR
jgi:hypothetical protein